MYFSVVEKCLITDTFDCCLFQVSDVCLTDRPVAPWPITTDPMTFMAWSSSGTGGEVIGKVPEAFENEGLGHLHRDSHLCSLGNTTRKTCDIQVKYICVDFSDVENQHESFGNRSLSSVYITGFETSYI